jgi:hypothetical protein
MFLLYFIVRKLFDQFDPSSIAQFTEKKLLSLKVNGNLLLSEPKLRAIVENAKQMLKVIKLSIQQPPRIACGRQSLVEVASIDKFKGLNSWFILI